MQVAFVTKLDLDPSELLDSAGIIEEITDALESVGFTVLGINVWGGEGRVEPLPEPPSPPTLSAQSLPQLTAFQQ